MELTALQLDESMTCIPTPNGCVMHTFSKRANATTAVFVPGWTIEDYETGEVDDDGEPVVGYRWVRSPEIAFPPPIMPPEPRQKAPQPTRYPEAVEFHPGSPVQAPPVEAPKRRPRQRPKLGGLLK